VVTPVHKAITILVIETKLVTETEQNHDGSESSQRHNPLFQVEGNYFFAEINVQR